MKQTKLIMGMPITIEILDDGVTQAIFKQVFGYFRSIDRQFSPYKSTSEVSQINQHKLDPGDASSLMQEVLTIAQQTKQETGGYFDVWHEGSFDPSGIVKGWAIAHASKLIENAGFHNYYVDAGGDVEVRGSNHANSKWSVGIRNPFATQSIVKVIYLGDEAIATSGSYMRGQHIYHPSSGKSPNDIVSLSVIGRDILEADRFATAGFAMGREGIYFIEKTLGLEGYMIDQLGIATYTSNFNKYTKQ